MSIVNELASNFDKMIKKAAVHELKSGETVGKIAKEYGVSEEQIFSANPGIKERVSKLQIGEVIQIPETSNTFSSSLAGKTLDQQIKMSANWANVPQDVFRALIKVESQNCTQNLSQKGARGCGQLMPSVISYFKIKDPDDPAQNLPVAAIYLKGLISNAPGKDEREKVWNGLMQYNWGSGNWSKWKMSEMKGSINTEAKNYPKKIFNLLGWEVPQTYQWMYSSNQPANNGDMISDVIKSVKNRWN